MPRPRMRPLARNTVMASNRSAEVLPPIVSDSGQAYDVDNPADVKIVTRAVIHGWPMSEEFKAKILESLAEMVEAGHHTPSIRLKAIRAVATLNQQSVDLALSEAKGQNPDQLNLHQHIHSTAPDFSRLTTQEVSDYRDLARKAAGNG